MQIAQARGRSADGTGEARPHHSVVIVGAGPSGLMVADELALAGITAVVLESGPGPSPEPKANALVGQVLRMLDMRGLYTRITGTQKRPTKNTAFTFSGIPVPLQQVPHHPMYTEFIPQPKLIRHLVDRAEELGVDIRWGHRLLEFDQRNEKVWLKAERGDEVVELTADIVVAADGARSVFRKQLGIGFPGTTHDTVGCGGQVSLPERNRTPDGGLEIPGVGKANLGHTRFEGGCLLLIEPQPGRTLMGTVEFRAPDGSREVTFDEFRESVARVVGTEIEFDVPPGPGPHALRKIDGQNTRLADSYRSGNVFLVGDSAHVHSPMGGPGLNLALQDAVNLAWKIAATVQGWAPADLLDTYFTERHAVGERLMRHSMAQLALMSPGSEVTALRSLLEEVFAIPDVASYLAHMVGGGDVRYDTGDHHALAGFFVPDWTLDDGRQVTDLLGQARPVLLDTADGTTGEVVAPWSDRIDVVVAPCGHAPKAMLIRPDGYVAWAGDAGPDSHEALRCVVRRWFGEPSENSGPLTAASKDQALDRQAASTS
ncbi:FAD-dependent monooxygenase [Streptomyces sp. NPDC004629]|uniref:FAD-dependent monooxygenase n=1 Tax=Streptomyces sp. NPDC004629 TaxID=3364705 RepID=UPI0036869EC1